MSLLWSILSLGWASEGLDVGIQSAMSLQDLMNHGIADRPSVLGSTRCLLEQRWSTLPVQMCCYKECLFIID